MSVFITGDVHGDYDIHKLNSTNFPKGCNLTKEDYVIITGDFGLLWSDRTDNTEKYWTDWYENKPWTTLFIDGNHENFNRINKLPEVDMFGFKVGKVSESIYHLKRGSLYTIEDKTFLIIGGAMSIDKARRIENVSWWSGELLSYEDEQRIFQTIDDNPKVDYVLSHTCPYSVFESFIGDDFKANDPTMKVLEEVLKRLQDFKHWYFGHFHFDKRLSERFTCLYQIIRKLQ